jgi:sugar (pentulose or hexulose) kinase
MIEKTGSLKVNENGKKFLGVELGSTRIKAVLIDQNHMPIVSGSHDWENKFEDGIWTYHLEDIWAGLQDCYKKLREAYSGKFGQALTSVDAIGFSAMMHGYMAFNKEDEILVPFRTWRNTNTGVAAEQLSEVFQFNIPQRWSVAHLYQAILNQEVHVSDIAYLTTLAGYIHWKLTGKKVLGIGDASGMFPIDSGVSDFDCHRLEQFDRLIAKKGYPWKLRQILPEVLSAGDDAGVLTSEGARLLDASGELQPGIPLCPPEGDAGTGMVATNSVAERTCNVSAGTSIFAMVVLEKSLAKLYPEIDMVTTPTGKPVAMVHANNCTSDINAWVDLFQELLKTMHVSLDQSALYETLFNKALSGDADGGGLLAFNFFSGEPIVHLEKGIPLFARTPDGRFSLANFMRVQLYSALGTMKLGMDILFDQEKVKIDRVLGHGGFFKTPVVGQKIMAAAMNVPVSVMETAGEGGAWGIAILAAYQQNKQERQPLEDYLNTKVFLGEGCFTVEPDPVDVEGFCRFMGRYEQGLPIEEAAVRLIKQVI